MKVTTEDVLLAVPTASDADCDDICVEINATDDGGNNWIAEDIREYAAQRR